MFHFSTQGNENNVFRPIPGTQYNVTHFVHLPLPGRSF